MLERLRTASESVKVEKRAFGVTISQKKKIVEKFGSIEAFDKYIIELTETLNKKT